MKKYVNGEWLEMTEEEVAKLNEQNKELEYQDRTRPRTEQEGIVAICRTLAKTQVATSDDKTLGIACMALFEPWTNGKYIVGDVRTDPKTGYPYECITPHDSIANPDYTIDNRTLWTPWHSHSADYALPYEQPTGAYDMYKNGEYMIWTDKLIYKAIADTVYSPDVRPEDWALTEN